MFRLLFLTLLLLLSPGLALAQTQDQYQRIAPGQNPNGAFGCEYWGKMAFPSAGTELWICTNPGDATNAAWTELSIGSGGGATGTGLLTFHVTAGSGGGTSGTVLEWNADGDAVDATDATGVPYAGDTDEWVTGAAPANVQEAFDSFMDNRAPSRNTVLMQWSGSGTAPAVGNAVEATTTGSSPLVGSSGHVSAKRPLFTGGISNQNPFLGVAASTPSVANDKFLVVTHGIASITPVNADCTSLTTYYTMYQDGSGGWACTAANSAFTVGYPMPVMYLGSFSGTHYAYVGSPGVVTIPTLQTGASTYPYRWWDGDVYFSLDDNFDGLDKPLAQTNLRCRNESGAQISVGTFAFIDDSLVDQDSTHDTDEAAGPSCTKSLANDLSLLPPSCLVTASTSNQGYTQGCFRRGVRDTSLVGTIGDPVYLSDTGVMSLTAGTVSWQVGVITNAAEGYVYYDLDHYERIERRIGPIQSIALQDPDTPFSGLIQIAWSKPALILEVFCSTDTGTATIQLDHRARTSPNAAGVDVMNSTLACDNNEQSTTSFNDDTPLTTQVTNLDIDSVASSPTQLRIHIRYREL